MARDIEEFLRRAAERRQNQKQGGPQAPQPQAFPPQPPPRAQPLQRAQVERLVEPEIIPDAEVVQNKPDRKKKAQRESVSEHVERYLDSSQITEKTKSLGSQVSKVGQNFDKKIHANLDHDLCSVDDGRTSVGIGSSKPAAENPMVMLVREMLAKPETVGQAILIAEILKRPDFEDE